MRGYRQGDLSRAHSHGGKLARTVGYGVSCLAVVAFGLVTGGATNAAASKNAGDVWVDNVGQPAGPGHENDPHLACADINLWGNGLAGSSGSFAIDGWPPSGSQELVYPSTWTYNQATGGDQVVQVINVATLIQNAVAAGDVPLSTQGFHFKLQFSLFPQKHKTFWVRNCQTPPPAPTLMVCQIAGQSISVGDNFTFTVGSQALTIAAGAAPNGNCVQATGPFTVGEQVTVTQTGPTKNQTIVDFITVDPVSALVNDNVTTRTATVSLGSGVTTVTYQDSD
jgi:hypothetical protein